MILYQPECTTCGAKGPTYRHRSPASMRNHVCRDTCRACNWRRTAHGKRGLCQSCWETDLRDDYSTKFRNADDMLDDWALLRSQGYTPRLAAERMGVTFAALDRALCRAKRNGDPRSARNELGSVA